MGGNKMFGKRSNFCLSSPQRDMAGARNTPSVGVDQLVCGTLAVSDGVAAVMAARMKHLSFLSVGYSFDPYYS